MAIVGLSRRSLLTGTVALASCARLQRGFVSGTALQYGLLPEERGVFRGAFSIYGKLLPSGVRGHAHVGGVVEKAIVDLADVIRTRADTLDTLTLRAPGSGGVIGLPADEHPKIVVFSDHHLTLGRHRHNLFTGSGGSHFRHANGGLYLAVLERYRAAGYTLVENGDAEDLVVFDAALHPGEYDERQRAVSSDDPDEALAGLVARRAVFRQDLLTRILADPQNLAYYRTLGEFAAEGRLVRVGGNHDYQVAPFWEDAAARARAITGVAYPDAGVHASLVWVGRGGQPWDAVIVHGHQFDHVSSPVNAPLHGETISECLGTFYQGADRVWPWAEARAWAEGAPFRNLLVSGIPTDGKALAELADGVGGSNPATAEARRRLWMRTGLGPQFWEETFGHPIAWDYFERGDEDSLGQVLTAIAQRETWFKFRHTEELQLAEQLPGALGEVSPPLLILGHTHEPRMGALDVRGAPVPWYLNAGAAGRFEGLLWGVELVHGEACVVSWHAEPWPGGTPVRRVWGPGGDWRQLLASQVRELS